VHTLNNITEDVNVIYLRETVTPVESLHVTKNCVSLNLRPYKKTTFQWGIILLSQISKKEREIMISDDREYGEEYAKIDGY
jgi:hypothetical protein